MPSVDQSIFTRHIRHLTPSAIVVYGHLVALANQYGQVIDFSPTVAADTTGLVRNTVKRCVRELLHYGLIRPIPQTKDGHWPRQSFEVVEGWKVRNPAERGEELVKS